MSVWGGPYYLINSHMAHDGPIRSISIGCHANEILTGCQSDVPVVRRWRLSEDKKNLEAIGEPLYHDHWVTAVTALSPDSSRNVYPDGCIITGCMDTFIRIFSTNGELLAKLQGHQKGVIDFSWSRDGNLISGSWDGTAIIWDLSSSSIIHRLGPHENGVHVLGLSNGNIATVSTGESVNGKPAHFRLRLWDASSGQMIAPFIEDHTGSIRSVRALPGIEGMITTANDGVVMIRSQEGQVIEMMQHPPQDDGSPPFILDCAALESDGGMDLVSCGEDGSVIIWQGADFIQQITHPSTVWTVLGLPGDETSRAFITAGHDGMLRIFSRASEISQDPLALQLTETFQLEVETARAARRRGPSQEELAKCPRWEDRGAHPGRSEHQVMVFNQDQKMIATQWISGAWVVIGEVTGSDQGSTDSGSINGVRYDHIFPVELETPTGLRQYQLGFNDLENPFIAAQRFIDQNGLGQYHLQEIADWIIARSKSSNQVPTIDSVPTMTANNYQNNSATTNNNNINTPTLPRKTFSGMINGYIIFDDTPASVKLISKLKEINELYVNTDRALNEFTFHRVENLVDLLCSSGNSSSNSLVTAGDIQLLESLLRWSAEHLFIVFDLLRLTAIHPSGSEELARHTTFYSILEKAVEVLSASSSPYQSILTTLRFLANTFKSEVIKRSPVYTSTQGKTLLTTVSVSASGLVGHSNKLVRLSALSLLCNLLAVHSFSHQQTLLLTKDVNMIYQKIVESSLQNISNETESVPTLVRALQALGTLIVLDTSNSYSVVQKLGGKSLLSDSLARWRVKSPGDSVLAMFTEVIQLM